MSQQPKLWFCYLAQNGNNVEVNITEETLEAVQQAIHYGRPFGVWFRTDAGRLTGITVNPIMGGLTLNVQPAQQIPIDANGGIAQAQNQVARWIQPHEQPIGELVYTAWSNSVGGLGPEPNGGGVVHPKPDERPTPPAPADKPSSPPPGPPGEG